VRNIAYSKDLEQKNCMKRNPASDLGGRGFTRCVDLGFTFQAATGTLNHCLGERTYVVVAEEWASPGVRNPGTAPPVIKDLLNRPWNTLAVIATWREWDLGCIYGIASAHLVFTCGE
jgi:hypothetical protein